MAGIEIHPLTGRFPSKLFNWVYKRGDKATRPNRVEVTSQSDQYEREIKLRCSYSLVNAPPVCFFSSKRNFQQGDKENLA